MLYPGRTVTLFFVLGTYSSSEYEAIFPEYQLAYLDTSPSIYCNSSSPPMWSKDGIPMDSRSHNPYYIYYNKVREVNSGRYKCEGTFQIKGIPTHLMFSAYSDLFVGSESVINVLYGGGGVEGGDALYTVSLNFLE